MNDPAVATPSPSPTDAAAPTVDPVAVPVAAPAAPIVDAKPFAWAVQPPTPQRFVMFVMDDGELRPAVVVRVNSEDADLAVFLADGDHPSGAPLIRKPAVRQDQDGKAPGTWHWTSYQASTAAAKPVA